MLAQIAWLLILMCGVGVVYIWWQSQEIKVLAKAAAERQCRELGLQYLDDSIILRGIAPNHLFKGRPCLLRRYVFEFSSTGDERYEGRVTTLGRRVTSVEVDAHRFH